MKQKLKHKNLHFAVAYVVLVALPLLGLAGVLKSGRTLAAPTSVGGIWRIQPGPDDKVTLPCGKSLSTTNARFMISQSGRSFNLSFDEMSSQSGVVQGNRIQASLLPAATWAKAGKCGKETVINLTATVDLSANLLTGVVVAERCPSCAATHFQAVREDQAKATGTN